MKKNQNYEAWYFHALKKTLLVMRLILVLSLISIIQSYALDSRAQNAKISLSVKEMKLEDILVQIESQTKYRFAYNKNEIDIDKNYSVNINDAEIKELLGQLFSKDKINYVIIDRQIILSPTYESSDTNQQQKTVTGKITDATGGSLPGVSVVVKGTTSGIITDVDGNYSLFVPANGKVLIFSFVGMKTQEVEIGNKTEINVTLLDETIGIEEVVAIGYGTKIKSTVTGSISTVNATEIKSLTTTNVADALQGKVSGAFVTASSGKPGASSNIYLRGPISISGGNPLYVVDGVPMTDLDYSFNMEDIESINVLKDASAASIYGTKAAGGVILVTTKRGSVKKAQISLTANYGVRNVINTPTLFERDDYIQAKKLVGYDVVNLFGPETGWSSLPNTNWFNEWYQPGIEQNYTLSVSGGGGISTYYISGNYNSIGGTLLNNSINRTTLRINSDHQILKKLKFTENVYVKSGIEHPPVVPGNGYLTFRSIPMMKVYDPNNLEGGWGMVPKGFQGSNNVARTTSLYGTNKDYSANLSGSLEYKIIEGLTAKAFFGTTIGFIDSYNYQNPYNDGAMAMLATFSKSISKSQSSIASYTLNYNKDFKGHSITGLLGYEARKSDSGNVIYRNQDSFVPQPQSSTLALGIKNLSSDFYQTDVLERMLSQFARMEYSYKGKYLFTANVRRDGFGSKFGPANRYGIFPGMSVGWVASQESFMSRFPAINILKLRAGYGVLGNAVGQDFAYSKYYVAGDPYDFSVGDVVKKETGLSIVGKLPNPDIQWESVATADVGFDISFWKSKLNISFDYYSRQTKKMLYNVGIAPSAGVGSSVQANIGQMSNKGIEFSAEYRNKIGQIGYNIGVNGGVNKNKLISLDPNIDRLYITSGDVGTGESGQGFYGTIAPARSEPGQPLGQFYGLQTNGIYQADAVGGETRPTYSGFTPQAGDLIYVDQNKDGKITTADYTYIGNPWPKLTYGITLGATWKGLELRAQFTGVYGNQIYNAFESWEYNFFSDYNSTSKIYETSLFNGNGVTDVPRTATLTKPDNNKNWGVFSDYHVQSGSYLRLKNIQLGYSLPSVIVKKFQIGEAKIYVSADNLFTITKYKGMDPEIPAQPLYGGILAQGLDLTSQRYPNSRIISVGVSLKF